MNLRTLVIAAAVALLCRCAMRTNLTAEKRQLEKELAAEVFAADRYVDLGVELRVVVPDLEGDELIPGKPKMRLVRTHCFGGLLDTGVRPPRITGPSRSRIVWFCSVEQEAVLLHDCQPRGQLVYGSEGAGKTTVLAMWHYLQWLKRLGEKREGLQTSPTLKRLGLLKAEIKKLWRPEWYRWIERKDFVGYELADGCTIRMTSTHRQSDAQGSPIQGSNNSWAGRDEMQDQLDPVFDIDADIENRGRDAKGGGEEYDQLGTATAKDSSAWRELRDRKLGSGTWIRRSLSIWRSPFVSRAFIMSKSAGMTDREFRRRMGREGHEVEDLPPERAVYGSWERAENLIAVPQIGWTDVTARELAANGSNFCALLGHDPGTLFDVTLVLKAYEDSAAIAREREAAARERRQPRVVLPVWLVVDEITTKKSTIEAHVNAVLERLVTRWHLNLRDRNGNPVADGPRALVRADPYGNNDQRPDKTVYTVWRNAGFTIKPAAFSTDGTGPGRVPKEAGIDVVNTLLCNSSEGPSRTHAFQKRRLFVARNPDGTTAAPKLVEAFESSERDTDGKAEAQRKNLRDLSHWPAALRYALWQVERPRLLALQGRSG